MHLRKALEIQVQFQDFVNCIHIDNDGYFCLNDMISFFPHKELRHWLENAQTKEYIKVIEKQLNPNLDNNLNIRDPGGLKFIPAIKTRRGRYGGGTYAHKYVAMKFAMWLSVEFEFEVIKTYEIGVERREEWDIKRVMAAHGYKFLTSAVKDNIVPEFEKNGANVRYAYTTEADLLNEVVFGYKASDVGKNQRNGATKDQLDMIEYLQQIDAGFIEAGLSYEQRKEKLTDLYKRKTNKLIS